MILEKKNKIVIIVVIMVTTLLLASGLLYNKFTKSIKIKNFNISVTECINNLNQCDFGDDEEEYNDLMAESNQAMQDENIDKIDELEHKLKEIEGKIFNKNKDAINIRFAQAKNIDISILNQDRKAEINNKITEIEGLIKDTQFKTSSDKIEELKKKETELILDQKLDNIDDLLQNDKRSEARKSINAIENEALNEEQKDKLTIYKNKAAMTLKEASIIGISKVFGEYKYVFPVTLGSKEYQSDEDINGEIVTWHGGLAQLDTSNDAKQFLFSTRPIEEVDSYDAKTIFDKYSSWIVVYPTKDEDGSFKIYGRYYETIITPGNGGDIVYNGSEGFHNGYIRVYPNEDIDIDGTINK